MFGFFSMDIGQRIKKKSTCDFKKNDKVYIFGNFQQNRCLCVLQELKRLQRMVLNFVMETCILATKKKKKKCKQTANQYQNILSLKINVFCK